jgi:hypothetical protein
LFTISKHFKTKNSKETLQILIDYLASPQHKWQNTNDSMQSRLGAYFCNHLSQIVPHGQMLLKHKWQNTNDSMQSKLGAYFCDHLSQVVPHGQMLLIVSSTT